MTGTRAVIAAVGVALLLGVAACSGDDPEPKVAPPSSSSTAPSSPSTSPASVDDPVDAVRAWVAAQNEALASGDSGAVRALATDDCRSCDGLIDPIDKVFKEGGHFETSGWRVDRAKQVGGAGNKATVNAAVTIAGGKTFPSQTADPVVFHVDRSILVFKLVRADGAWRVNFIGFLS